MIMHRNYSRDKGWRSNDDDGGSDTEERDINDVPRNTIRNNKPLFSLTAMQFQATEPFDFLAQDPIIVRGNGKWNATACHPCQASARISHGQLGFMKGTQEFSGDNRAWNANESGAFMWRWFG